MGIGRPSAKYKRNMCPPNETEQTVRLADSRVSPCPPECETRFTATMDSEHIHQLVLNQ